MSSGHSKYVRGASGIIDEVDEARLVVEHVANELRGRGVDVVTYHDDVSKTQNENLNRIVNFHNSKARDLDISVHFNASKPTANPVGTEVYYKTQSTLADNMSAAIASVGFKDRGHKHSDDLFFLNKTAMPSILIEVCFVDSEADCKIYGTYFDMICENIASVIGGGDEVAVPPPSSESHKITGKVSHFGGPDDMGVDPDEGLAFIYDIDDAPHLFLPYQPEGTTGLARRLNPYIHYIACRWNYDLTPKETLLEVTVSVKALKTGITLTAFPADWGPHGSTNRVADISPGLMFDLGISTDDEVEVTFPYEIEYLV
jgi:hypothetical protein